MVGKGGLAEPQAPFLEQISVFQTTDAGIYMNVVDNDPCLLYTSTAVAAVCPSFKPADRSV